MSKFELVALALAVLAAGCVNDVPLERQWTKADATPEDVKRDLYWCSRQFRAPLKAEEGPSEQKEVIVRVDDACMEKRGYAKVNPKS